ncbi:hypothetical protein B0H17DRAFT_1117188 [Mycena rosella]|uniref:MSP domain-containing protein n=1 Tax=Mycena rosella TaxID=1033263 RepID=A0AAD7B7J0_MYCRO|nr:hypothetical protein B0H17DRAFT_1117188 [Mycena rosella]
MECRIKKKEKLALLVPTMSVSLAPSNTLGFRRPLNILVKRPLTITNPNAESAVAWKVKTTAPTVLENSADASDERKAESTAKLRVVYLPAEGQTPYTTLTFQQRYATGVTESASAPGASTPPGDPSVALEEPQAKYTSFDAPGIILAPSEASVSASEPVPAAAPLPATIPLQRRTRKLSDERTTVDVAVEGTPIQEGVPPQVVVIIALGVFITTYLFF